MKTVVENLQRLLSSMTIDGWVKIIRHNGFFSAAEKWADLINSPEFKMAERIRNSPAYQEAQRLQEVLDNNPSIKVAQEIEERIRNNPGYIAAENVEQQIREQEAILYSPNVKLALELSSRLSDIERISMTPELTALRTQMLAGDGVAATALYLEQIQEQWNAAKEIENQISRSIPSQNLAIIRLDPEYASLGISSEIKSALSGLTVSAARALTETDEIAFDPVECRFYHEEEPDQSLSADEITVVTSGNGLELFADITFSELVKFESKLMDNYGMANRTDTGRKIYDIIANWNSLIDFDRDEFFHARKVDGDKYFLNQEMLKAPFNVASHGRYNAIGRGVYYFAESQYGAVNEIKKHIGRSKSKIQVAEIKPRVGRSVRLIDLSGNADKNNIFVDHQRKTVDIAPGAVIKEYLLPNYVADCCREVGIDGIKYRSGSKKNGYYNCYVTWEDGYFDFINQVIV